MTGKEIKTAEGSQYQLQAEASRQGWGTAGDQSLKAERKATQYIFCQEVEELITVTPRGEEVIPTEGLLQKLSNSFSNDYLNQLGSLIIARELTGANYIKLEVFLTYIEDNICKAKGISNTNWRKFLNAKGEIPKNAFIAYCHILGIDDWESVADLHPIYKERKRHEKKFIDGLSWFNHQSQVDQLQDYLKKEKRVFLISNQCLYSPTWMLRRIQKELSRTQETQLIFLKTASNSPMPLNRLFKEKVYPKLTKIASNNLVFSINIENYDLEGLEFLINELWSKVCESESESSGYALLFLIDKNQHQMLQQIQELSTRVVLLDNANPFDSSHAPSLKKTIDDIIVATRQPLQAGDDLLQISKTIINDTGKNTSNLLKRLYKEFNITNAELDKTWKISP